MYLATSPSADSIQDGNKCENSFGIQNWLLFSIFLFIIFFLFSTFFSLVFFFYDCIIVVVWFFILHSIHPDYCFQWIIVLGPYFFLLFISILLLFGFPLIRSKLVQQNICLNKKRAKNQHKATIIEKKALKLIKW